MDFAKEFAICADAWSAHFHQIFRGVEDHALVSHASYYRLLELNMPAVPYIIERYKVAAVPWWGLVLGSLTGHMGIDPYCNSHYTTESGVLEEVLALREATMRGFQPEEQQRLWIAWWDRLELQKRLITEAVRKQGREPDPVIAAQFNILAEEWVVHCNTPLVRISFFDAQFTHPSYDKLVALGLPAVPLIMEWYNQKDWSCYWGLLLEDITKIQFTNRYRISSLLDTQWFSWWENVWQDTPPTT